MNPETSSESGNLAAADAAMAPVVELLELRDHSQWDAFVLQHPQGSPFHLIAWKNTIQESFGFQPFYLVARRGERISGVLPMFLVKNPIIGRVLISSPFAVYGGILAEEIESRQELYEHAIRIGREHAVQYVEFRNTSPEQCVGESNVSRYVSFSQALSPDEQTTLEGLPKKTRNMVRKALKQPFQMKYQVQNLKHFEALYSRNMRRLGTPCFSPKYFQSLVKNFGSMIDVREVWLDGKPLAASLNFLFKADMHIYYAAADTRYNALGPNTYMYFDHLRWAGASGYLSFDFGRCKRGTSVFEFKRHWNTVMRELPYEIVLIGRKELPNFSPANPRFDLAIQVWRRLPLGLTRLFGPLLIRLFP